MSVSGAFFHVSLCPGNQSQSPRLRKHPPGSERGRGKKNKAKQKQEKQKGERGRFVQHPPARGQFARSGGIPLCPPRASPARWAEMQIPLPPLIRIFKFSNIYAATIEWQLTSLIFIEEIRKPWAAVNLAGPWPPQARGGGAGNNPFIQTFGLKE